MNSLQTELARVTGKQAPKRTTQCDEIKALLRKAKRNRHAPPPSYRASDGKRRNGDWAQHTCDMHSFYHGKRKAKRGDAKRPAYGMATVLYRQMVPGQFLQGKGLRRSRLDFALYVQGSLRGYLNDINEALAWAKAAKAHGHEAECVDVRS